ncbi:restriction endonuclease subunit S [Paenibacillus barengoltzii]|uniref:restriction endonuclease subunit S n=1 Tax=Paenibacillus barengoltzii TaxID=343517 RepID=UPI000FDC6C1A|nr:restriction endonuclease subunit S [Paenibacillus barengoltzii]
MKTMDGWEEKRLTELAEFINGYAFKPSDWGKDGLPIVRIEQLKNPDAPTDYFSGKLPPAYIVEDGDLIFSWSASLFLRIWNYGRAVLNQHLFKVVEREGVDRVFLKSFIEFYLPELTKASHGSTMQHITRKELEGFKALFPISKREQTKIADILATVDRAIEQTEALIAKKRRIKAGLLQDLLTRGIDEQGNIRSEQTHKFKDSPLGRIPVEWEVRRLGTLLESINQGWSPNCESTPASMNEWGVLKTTAVTWEGFFENENKALPDNLKHRPSLEIKTGDLLMTRAGPNSRVGVVSYVYSTRSKLMLSDKIYRLVPIESVDGRFLCYALSSFAAQRYLSNLKTGMAESQTNISQEIVKNLLSVVPSKEEQVMIADILDQQSKDTKQINETLKKLHSLKTALMKDLLTGKKRVATLLNEKELMSG